MMEYFENIVLESWPWYVGGPLIGLFVITLLLVEKKQLGISSSLQYTCAKLLPVQWEYFQPERIIRGKWQFFFVIGLIAGGFICSFIPDYTIDLSSNSITKLQAFQIEWGKGFFPKELFAISPDMISWLLLGGFLTGFGARYANGCTAGHAIMGVSQLSVASVVSTACFFTGGLIATYFILPLIF